VSEPTSPAGPPAEITHLVRERMEARARGDWATADTLKARIEALGWRVTDHGRRSSVSPAMPASLEVAGELRYGSAAAVPSVLDEPVAAGWTVAIVASEAPNRVSRLLAALRVHAPGGTQVVLVANDPSNSQAAALEPGTPDRAPIGGSVPEVLRTSTRLGFAATLNIALRRAQGEIVILADGSAWPTGDAFSSLASALADPAIAAVGGFGLVASAAGALRPNALERPDGSFAVQDVAALEAGWLAFRRSDYRDLGPLDEHFVSPAWLDVWWTLRLRVGAEAEEEPEADETATAADERTEPTPVTSPTFDTSPEPAESSELPAPRRAVRLELPLFREETLRPPDRSRLNRRNMYRVLDLFGWRDDLI
jgi:hypothetical protein